MAVVETIKSTLRRAPEGLPATIISERQRLSYGTVHKALIQHPDVFERVWRDAKTSVWKLKPQA